MSELIQEGIPCLSRKRTGVVVVIILLGVCASAVLYQITAQGPGVSPDSTIYIEVARTVLTGNGFFVDGEPMTHYPPVYPLLLAAVGSFTGNDILLAARLLSALLFGVNLVLVALAVYMCTKHDMEEDVGLRAARLQRASGSKPDRLLATGLVILIFLLSAPILSIHSTKLSNLR